MAETMVEIDHEVTLLTVRSTGRGGPRVQFCEPIGHRQVDGELLESWQPQEMTDAAARRGQVDRGPDRQRTRRARGVRRRAAGEGRRGVLRRCQRTAIGQRPGHPALAAAVGVRAARPRDPRAAGGHDHDHAGGGRGGVRKPGNRVPANADLAARRVRTERADAGDFGLRSRYPRATCGSSGTPRAIRAAGSGSRWPPRADVKAARDRVASGRRPRCGSSGRCSDDDDFRATTEERGSLMPFGVALAVFGSS